MELSAARTLLGLSDGPHSSVEIESAWAAKAGAYEPQLLQANAATTARLELELTQLLAAKNALLAAQPAAVLAAAGSMSRSGGGKGTLPPLPPTVPPLPPSAPVAAAPSSGIAFVPGTVLANRYEIRGLLGQGGMGVVYAASDRLKRNEEIALKVLTPALVSNPAAKERFINEAIIATRLNHPGIVKVHAPEQHGDLIFLTMEKLEGRSLRQVLVDCRARGAQLAVSEVVRIARALCDALHYAHQLPTPIVHRDIKPENVFICADGSLRLMDFGLAQNLAGPQLTAVATTMGTMHYMAPEQSGDARNVDHRADQYAFAVTVYEMLVGRVPQGKFLEPRALRKAVPATLSAAVMRGLNTAPGRRFPDLSAFRAQLVDKESGLTRFLASENRDMVLTGAFVVVLLGGAAFMAFGRTGSSPATTAATAAPIATLTPLTNKPAKPAAGGTAQVPTGGISIVTTPPGAEVTVGARYAANSPARFTNVPVGRYPVRVMLRDYKEITFELEVTADAFASRIIDLEPRLVIGSPAEFYAETLRVMQAAEEARRQGKADVAQEKWSDALERLQLLASRDKSWQPLVVAQRIRECQANLRK